MLGRSGEAREAESILMDHKQEIVAVCLHGMGGVGKTTLADHIFNNVLSKFHNNSRVKMDLNFNEEELFQYQKQILLDMSGSNQKADHEIIRDDLRGREMLELCDGLPLALELMGSFIAWDENGGGRNVEAWRHVVKSMKEATPVYGDKDDKLYASLRASIDSLVDDLKADFFDLVTSMDHTDTDGVEDFYRYHGVKGKLTLGSIVSEQGMQNLINRHLLEDTGEDVIGCHDVIRALVKSMVSSHRDQLRITGEQLSALEDDAELKNIVCLRCETSSITAEDLRRLDQMKRLRYAKIKLPIVAGREDVIRVEIDLPNLKALFMHAERHDHVIVTLGKCPELRVLFASNVQLNWQRATSLQYLLIDSGHEIHQNLSNCVSSLRHLSLDRCSSLTAFPHSSSPSCFFSSSLQTLRIISCESLLQVSDAIRHFSQLTELSINVCDKLRSLPETMFDKMGSSLSVLSLLGCRNLKTLPEGISVLTSLTELDLRYCSSITSLPKGMRNLLNLGKLLCDDIPFKQLLDDMVEKMRHNLSLLSLTGCEDLEMLPEGMGDLVNLQDLELDGCISLEKLPDNMFKNLANSLLTLNLGGCENLKALPEGISVLTSLIRLDLSSCRSIAFLPDGIRNLVKLQGLQLRYCTNLKRLPYDMFENMTHTLSTLNLSGCKNLEMLPEGISKLTSFTRLDLSGCKSITFLPQGMGNLISLRDLRVRDCTNLKKLPDNMFEKLANNLSTLDLVGCENLEMLPEGISLLTSLTHLHLPGCNSMTCLPKGIGNLIILQSLQLNGYTNLKNLPDNMFEKLTNNLSTIDLTGCENLEMLPEGISLLTSLTSFNLVRCKSIITLPDGMGNLVHLQSLQLKDWTNLKKLPDNMFEKLANKLSSLDLSGCENLEMLPEGISVLTSLNEIDLSGCKSITSLPEGMRNLVKLKYLRLRQYSDLEKLPDDMFEKITDSLLRLDLSRCKNLEMLPEGISRLTSLTGLDLSGCKSMTSLSQGMANLASLQHLFLRDCINLKRLPDNMFENLANSLSTLDLSGCENLQTLPERISLLTSLSALDLTRCRSLESLPEGIGNLVSLRDFRLSYCSDLKRLPHGMLVERVGNKLEALSLVGCEKLGFPTTMAPETVRTAICSMGLDPNRCHFMDMKALGQRESCREEAFRSRSSFPSLRIKHIQQFVRKYNDDDDGGDGAGIDVQEAMEFVAFVMRSLRQSREERRKEGMREEVVLLY